MVKHAGVWVLLLFSSWSSVGINRLAQAQPLADTQQTPTCHTAADLSYCRYPGPGPLLVLLTATDHRSPQAFEQEWFQIQAQTAAQSPLGRQVMAQGSGHDIHHDQPELVTEQIRQLMRQLRHDL
jgi:hypothetical protein